MSTHGPQFDEFPAQSGEHRGGALFDEHHGGPAATPGKDDYGDGRKPTAEPLWDSFAWREMPTLHGRHFDTDFREPCALEGEHGTWHDVFARGATRVRGIAEGHDVEGPVIHVAGDHVRVKVGNREVELGLMQLTEFQQATDSGQPSSSRMRSAKVEAQGHVGRSDAEAPSAHSTKASGHGSRTTVEPAVDESVFTNKTDGESVDVAKTLGDLRDLAGLTEA